MFDKSFRISACLGIALLLSSSAWGMEDDSSNTVYSNPVKTMRADSLHLDGIRGQGRLAIIFDNKFNPKRTEALIRKGVIHPDALKPGNPYVLTSEDMTYEDSIYKRWKAGEGVTVQVVDEDKFRRRRNYSDDLNLPDSNNHGSGVMEAFHAIAPDAIILPVDIELARKDNPTVKPEELCKTILLDLLGKGADIINFSHTKPFFYHESRNIIKEAIDREIAIMVAAGNDSLGTFRLRRISQRQPPAQSVEKSEHQELFEHVQGKGVFFAGSLKHKKNGKEKVYYSAQLPDDDKRSQFLLTDGCNLPFHQYNNSEPTDGSSFASPELAGAMILLKQYCLREEYNCGSPEDLFAVLYESGREVPYTFKGTPEIYKTPDLSEAVKLADKKFSS